LGFFSPAETLLSFQAFLSVAVSLKKAFRFIAFSDITGNSMKNASICQSAESILRKASNVRKRIR